jgi:asparagine synthase (glutamine-hydrolysing)
MVATLVHRGPDSGERLVEFAARIPTRLKPRGTEGKQIFRRPLRALVPPEGLARPKRGFDVPLRSWTRGRLRPMIEEAIQESPSDLFDRPALRVWRDHLTGRRNHAELFWTVLMLDRWRRIHAGALP